MDRHRATAKTTLTHSVAQYKLSRNAETEFAIKREKIRWFGHVDHKDDDAKSG